MARNKVVQVACEVNVYKKIREYRSDNNLSSDASAVRQLMLIGLETLSSHTDSNRPSDRELLENILFHVTKNNNEVSNLMAEMDIQ